MNREIHVPLREGLKARFLSATRPITGLSFSLPQILVFFAFAFLFGCFLPTPPWPIGTGLDASWILAINLAHAKHLIFGSDLFWTFGPLGYLMLPVFPQAEVWAVWTYHIGLFVLWVQAIVRLQFVIRPRGLAFLTGSGLCILGLLMSGSPMDRIPLTVASIAILILSRLPKTSEFDLAVLGLLSGVVLLVKFNLGVQAIAVYLCLLLIGTLPVRTNAAKSWLKLSAYFALPALSAFFAFAIVSGNVSSFVPFIWTSLELASGYSESMAFVGPAWQVQLAVASMAGFLAITLVLGRKSRPVLAAALPASVYMFFAFKTAIVRQDMGHSALFEAYMGIAATFVLVCVTRLRDRVVLSLVVGLFGILGFLMIQSYLPGESAVLLEKLQGDRIVHSIDIFTHFKSYTDSIAAQEPGLLAASKLPESVTSLIGSETMDVFTSSIDRAPANHFNWDPRPVLQSYSAYTPALDRLDAAHFANADRPRKVLWEWQSIDGRYLPADEPLVFSNLLDHYDIAMANSKLSIMTARSKVRFTKPIDIANGQAELDKSFPVPKVGWNELAILHADVHENLLGKLWTFLYRGDLMTMEATLASGAQLRTRVIWRNLADGLIASDWFDGIQDLQTAVSGSRGGEADRIAALKFNAPTPLFFDSRLELRWSKVGITTAGAANSWPAPPLGPPLRTETLWTTRDALPAAGNCTVSIVSGHLNVVAANLDPQLFFQLGPRLGEFRTLIIKAKFQARDDVEAFFGQLSNGRGYKGEGSIANHWVNVYIPVSSNPYWKNEHGTSIRFDPTSSRGVQTTTQIQEILGSTEEIPGSEIQIFLNSDSH